MPRIIATIITSLIFLMSGQIINAQDIWDNWSVSEISKYLHNISPKNIEEGIYRNYSGDSGYPTYRNATQSDGVLDFEIPLILKMSPLKPFQLKILITIESGTINFSLNGETNLGNRSISKQFTNSLGGSFRDRLEIIIEYDLQSTLTLKHSDWNGSNTYTDGQIYNCKSIGPLKISLKPHAWATFIPTFNYRQMSFRGIEQETLRLANSYANNGDFITTKAILDHFIDDYGCHNSYEVFIMRAICNGELRNLDAVIKDATSAISLKANCEYAYFIRGVAKLKKNDFSGISDLKLGGQDGKKYMLEHHLTDSNYGPSVNGSSMAVVPTILSAIVPTKKTITLSAKQIYNKYNNAVFMIYTKGLDGISQGSGFFIGKDGLAISNYHVFEGAIRGKEQVKLMNGGTYQVKEILGYDKAKDFIIFRVDGTGFTNIPITKRGYEIGDEVYAIGSPRGMQNTLSNGLVSQKWDDTKFQISVPIDHGSSGGALINQYGEVIGITSGGRDDTHANLNYAIDIRTIFNQNEQ